MELFPSIVSRKRLYVSEPLCFDMYRSPDLKGTTVDITICTRQLTLCTFAVLRILSTSTNDWLRSLLDAHYCIEMKYAHLQSEKLQGMVVNTSYASTCVAKGRS